MNSDLTAGGLGQSLGLRHEALGAERTVVSLEVGPAHLQAQGIVHGGVYCTLVETAASIGAGLWWGARGRVVGAANQTDFLRPVQHGRLTASAVPVHRGRSQQLWSVDVVDSEEHLVARGQVRLANLPLPSAADTPPGGG
ncbi:thioesterase superfamily protein [Streptomyces albus]|uniref:Thioesterase superfamily protein n=1 Tax=Streptomyces albus (strain ATCC 21838 / DSM 41398 / FERM P-419 / JCM 4703 / NBRC 107858) TaxID=1081613 RepID=A0A0B5EWW6_STRA4|nr:thioesterase superfamily protein [Streptomyces albus]AOU81601.1 thioesterase superfamily protein [Streptomyces albus]AYN37293.1 PaaI family thioesterase [Streptomyces albus]